MIRFTLILGLCISFSSAAQMDMDFSGSEFVPIPQNGTWAWYDVANDSISAEYVFTDFMKPKSGYTSDFVLKNDSLWGIMSSAGGEREPFLYDSIIFHNPRLITLSKNQWSYHYASDSGNDSLIAIYFDSLYFDGTHMYLYHAGKTGLITDYGTVIATKYDAIHPFDCSQGASESSYLMTIKGTEFNLLNYDGSELLPIGVWDLRCTEDGVFEFRRDEFPEYFVPYMEEFIRPNGHDIVFYGSEGYKIYSADKTQAELHLADGRVLKETYDDYFLLSDNYIAVRKGGKIGLTLNGTELRSAIKYDQINPVSTARYFNELTYQFKFYYGDSCGLMTDQGTELFDANYANIVPTADPDRYIVMDRQRTGVVDGVGRSVIPIKYDYIYYDYGSQLFIVQNAKKIGLFRRDGIQLVPIEYDRQRILQSVLPGEGGSLHVLGKGQYFYFANSNGLIENTGFSHYDHTPSILKTYDSKGINVYIFDDAGNIEEKQRYPIFEKAVIKKDLNLDWGSLNSWSISVLEENQQAGYFGLRWYTQRGFGIPPTYRTVRVTFFKDFIGEVAISRDSIEWMEGIPMQLIRGYDHLKTGEGKISTNTFFNTEICSNYRGSGDRYVNFELNKDQVRSYIKLEQYGVMSIARSIQYAEKPTEQNEYRRHIVGGLTKMCTIDSADVSLYDYYTYWNSVDAIRLSPELMKKVLNPKVGVKFENSEVAIVNASWLGVSKDHISFTSTEFFKEFEFVGLKCYFQQGQKDATGKLRMVNKAKVDDEKDPKEVIIENVLRTSEAEGYISDLVLADIKYPQTAKLHVDHPTYFFVPDSVYLTYNAGRVVQRIDSTNFRLISPTGKVVRDIALLIRYLNEERFACLSPKGWELIDKNGKPMSDQYFSRVNDFVDKRAEFTYADGRAVLIDLNGTVLEPLPESRTFIDKVHYFYGSNPPEINDSRTKVTDRARENETYFSSGFFVSKSNGESILRRFGSTQSITLKTTSLTSFGFGAYFKDGKHLITIDSSLVFVKHKKVDKFRVVNNEIGVLEGKRDELVDRNWNRICRLENDEGYEIRDGILIVKLADESEKSFGSQVPLSERSTQMVDTIPETKVISENGNYGVKRGGETVLPTVYEWLSKINDTEYYTRTRVEKQIFNANLERIGKNSFDWFIETASGNYVFYRLGDYTVLRMNEVQGDD